MESTDSLILNQYRKLTTLGGKEDKPVYLVQHVVSRECFVEKHVHPCALPALNALSALPNTPGIPKIYTWAQSGDTIAVIEDYINGRDLETILANNGPLPPETAAGITQKLCAVLTTLHNAPTPIIHRDIKPSNVMISSDHVVKLIDFDSARLFDPSVTGDTTKLGTEGFAPPEQFGFMQTDARSDIYALGVLLNVMLTGEMPGTRLAAAPFDRIVTKCIQMDPGARYTSANQLSGALILAVRTLNFKNDPCRIHSTDWRSWLPPGFRSGHPAFMLLAIAIYGLLIALCSAMSLNRGAHIFFVLASLGLTIFFGNYRNIRDTLPLMQDPSPVRRIIGWFLWPVIFLCVTLCLSGLLSSLPL